VTLDGTPSKFQHPYGRHLALFLATPLDALVIEGRLLIKAAVAVDASAAGSRATTARQLGVS